jgi:hypothetical protein
VLSRLVAALLYSASLDIPTPEFWRHTRARRDLMIAMRQEIERWWWVRPS